MALRNCKRGGMEAAKVWPGEIAAMRLSRNASKARGFTLLEIMVVVVIVGLLASIAVSNVIIARDNSRLTIIRHNLRKIDEAKQQWAADNKQVNGALVADMTVLSGYFRGGDINQVAQETYVPNAIGTPPEAALPPGVSLGPYGPGASIPAP
jgi:prepilin-type N-terminal cleavage/methylation domain-containing protein